MQPVAAHSVLQPSLVPCVRCRASYTASYTAGSSRSIAKQPRVVSWNCWGSRTRQTKEWEQRAGRIFGDDGKRDEATQKGAERLMWRTIYLQLAAEAKNVGIPTSAVPNVEDDADANTIKAAHQQLTNIIESFSSSGL